MLVDDIGEVTITNDGATILQQLEVEHPAAKVLVELADLQDKEVGDGTTSVVIIAGELLRRANELVRAKLHPTSIMSGYRLALRESIRYIKEHLLIPSTEVSREILIAAAKTSMSSKIISKSSDFFSSMVVDAVSSVGRKGADGKMKYPVSAVNVVKVHGRSSLESTVVPGIALNNTRSSTAMPSHIKGARIACIDFPLQKHRMQLGVQIVVTDPKKLEAIRQRELDITKEKIEKLISAGANVILTTRGIDDLCQKYLIDAGCIGVRRVSAGDIKRIAVATGAIVLPNIADLEGGESVDPASLGEAEEVVEERVGDHELLFVRGCKTARSTSLVLRGANEFMLEEVHRSLHDAMCIVKRVLESKSVVCGGGAVEAALAMHLEDFAMSMGSREQLAIKEFAEALLVIPKTLAVNAAKDSTDLIAKLCSYHHTSQTVVSPGPRARIASTCRAGDREVLPRRLASRLAAAPLAEPCSESDPAEKEGLKYYGLDLKAGEIVDNVERGVLEPAMSKVKSLRFATEAAVTIMRIDDRITIRAAEQGQGGGHMH
ncbi:TCP1 [Symbiodinium sp. KB8]|nr:TCP1 [Symbiodinium sp. KB8]